eukprot:364904-Chlamydomonas_euryale.AAC.4
MACFVIVCALDQHLQSWKQHPVQEGRGYHCRSSDWPAQRQPACSDINEPVCGCGWVCFRV